MHDTSTAASRPTARRWRFLALLGALLLLALAQAVPAFAAGPFTGGANLGDYPLYVANDHSVSALRFTASGLTPIWPRPRERRLGAAPTGATTRTRILWMAR
jgi:hypothetical protein